MSVCMQVHTCGVQVPYSRKRKIWCCTKDVETSPHPWTFLSGMCIWWHTLSLAVKVICREKVKNRRPGGGGRKGKGTKKRRGKGHEKNKRKRCPRSSGKHLSSSLAESVRGWKWKADCRVAAEGPQQYKSLKHLRQCAYWKYMAFILVLTLLFGFKRTW